MEGVLNELGAEAERLEALLAAKVPRGRDYVLQWTLNRLVKRKVEQTAARLAGATARLMQVLGTDVAADDPQRPSKVVDMLQTLQRKKDYALKVADGKRCSLYDRLAEANGVAAAQPALEEFKTRDKKVLRTGENFVWLFQPPFMHEAHKLAPVAQPPIRYPKRWLELAKKYRCSGIKYTECVEYVRLAHEWHRDHSIDTCLSPYAPELDAIQRVYARQDDDWGYEIKAGVRALLMKPSPPLPFEKLRGVHETSTRHNPNEDNEPLQKHAKLIATSQALTDFVGLLLELEPIRPGEIPAIAVDVEFTQRGSFRGAVSLIQISTPTEDYIIDPVSIPKATMHELNRVTASPGILKVMHGIDHDVIWLQVDFGIYLVNVFDTFHAAKKLRVPGGNSLYNLVLQYCEIALEKSLQTSDWRVRPLTLAQIKYAREDTRYLLHVFGAMRNQILTMTKEPYEWTGPQPAGGAPLVSTSLGRKSMLAVLQASQETAATVPNWSPPNLRNKLDRLHQTIASSNEPITNRLRLCAEILFAWRDLRARDLNEAPQVIATDAMLYRALLKYVSSPVKFKEALPGLNADAIKAMQTLLGETMQKIPNPDEVYIGLALAKKRPRSAMPSSSDSAAVPEVDSASAVSSAAAPSCEKVRKRRKLLTTEVDKLKSERADDGSLTCITEHEFSEDEDLEVSVRGFYQAGARRLACFEKRGTQTSKSVMELRDLPPWLCVLDSNLLTSEVCRPVA